MFDDLIRDIPSNPKPKLEIVRLTREEYNNIPQLFDPIPEGFGVGSFIKVMSNVYRVVWIDGADIKVDPVNYEIVD